MTAIVVCMTVLVGCVTDGSAENDYPALPLDAEDDFDVFLENPSLSDDVRNEDDDDGFNALNDSGPGTPAIFFFQDTLADEVARLRKHCTRLLERIRALEERVRKSAPQSPR